MIPGETISSGAPPTCSECNETPALNVYRSPGGDGYYIGTYCSCGPYSRESDYFKELENASEALKQWGLGNFVGRR